MLRCNSPPNKSDGELALRLGGKPVTDIPPGGRHGRWAGMGFSPVDEGDESFEGFRWHTNDALKDQLLLAAALRGR